MKLTVLITNRSLSAPTGTELYAQDLGMGLRKAGHLPILYGPRLGPLAAKIHSAIKEDYYENWLIAESEAS